MKAIGQRSLASILAVLVTIAWHLARIVFAIGVVILAVAPFVDPPNIEIQFAAPVAFTLDSSSHTVTSMVGDAERLRLDDTEGSLYFSPRSSRVVAFGALLMIAWAGLCVWMLGNLQGLFATLRNGRPFVPANATRIRRIAWGVIWLEITGTIASYATSYGVMTRFEAVGLRFHTRADFDVTAIIAALILFVIAEVFREGARLDEEQSLTV